MSTWGVVVGAPLVGGGCCFEGIGASAHERIASPTLMMQAPFAMTEPRHVAVAEVARPHGVQGDLRLKVYNLASDLLLQRPDVRLRLPDGSLRPDRIRSVRRIEGAMLVRLDSVATRDEAERVRGAVLEVPRSALGEAGEGEYFHCDLEGCEVRYGDRAGRVVRVLSYPTCDALLVERSDGAKVEVPLTDAYLAEVDLEGRVIALHAWPE